MRTAKVLLRKSEIDERSHAYEQRLNPDSGFVGTALSRLCGLERAQVTLARLGPGKDSFAYHAHLLEEEWMYVISGHGIALVDGAEHEIGPGDFLGFTAPSVPHLVKNRGREELVYLMGGEQKPLDVVDYPQLGKRYALVATPQGTEFYELGTPTKPFGRKTEG